MARKVRKQIWKKKIENRSISVNETAETDAVYQTNVIRSENGIYSKTSTIASVRFWNDKKQTISQSTIQSIQSHVQTSTTPTSFRSIKRRRTIQFRSVLINDLFISNVFIDSRSSAAENRKSVIRFFDVLENLGDVIPKTKKQKTRNKKSRFDENVSNSDVISDRLSQFRSYMARDLFHIRATWFADRRFAKNWQRKLNDQLIKNLIERQIESEPVFFRINKSDLIVSATSFPTDSKTRRVVQMKPSFVVETEPFIPVETSLIRSKTSTSIAFTIVMSFEQSSEQQQRRGRRMAIKKTETKTTKKRFYKNIINRLFNFFYDQDGHMGSDSFVDIQKTWRTTTAAVNAMTDEVNEFEVPPEPFVLKS